MKGNNPIMFYLFIYFLYLVFLIFCIKKISDDFTPLTQKERCPEKHSKISLFWEEPFGGLSQPLQMMQLDAKW